MIPFWVVERDVFSEWFFDHLIEALKQTQTPYEIVKMNP